MSALGLIETIGFTAAVEAADAMMKAADVVFLEHAVIGAGLVTVAVAGEVAAVRAAVDAAVAAVARLREDALRSSHVIPRPDTAVARVLKISTHPEETRTATDANGAAEGTFPPADAAASAPSPGETRPHEAETTETEEAADPAASGRAEPADFARLNRYSLKKLRDTALSVDGFPMSPNAVAAADKKTLLAAFMNLPKKHEEQ